MAFNTEGFDRQAILPPELKVSHIRRAIEYIERETTELVEVYFEQANMFSGLVGIFGVRALHSLSPYKKHKHPDVAQQRFPDLSLGGKLNPPPNRHWSRKEPLVRGPCNRITITPAGTSFGGIWSIPRGLSRLKGPS